MSAVPCHLYAGNHATIVTVRVPLLQGTNTRFVLVDNVCEPEGRVRLEQVVRSEPRFDYLRLPGEHAMQHGDALGFLFSQCRERFFAVLDSDIVVSGDFMQGFVLPRNGSGAVCGAPAV